MRNSSIIMYTTEDGLTKIETTFDEDTVWLSLDQQSFFKEINLLSPRHIKNIFEEGELQLEIQLLQILQLPLMEKHIR